MGDYSYTVCILCPRKAGLYYSGNGLDAGSHVFQQQVTPLSLRTIICKQDVMRSDMSEHTELANDRLTLSLKKHYFT